jgi:SAM-dependent methyltransferase
VAARVCAVWDTDAGVRFTLGGGVSVLDAAATAVKPILAPAPVYLGVRQRGVASAVEAAAAMAGAEAATAAAAAAAVAVATAAATSAAPLAGGGGAAGGDTAAAAAAAAAASSGPESLSPAHHAAIRGAVTAALPAAVAAALPAAVAAALAAATPPAAGGGGPLLLGRTVRWGCDMSSAQARAASARATALLPFPTTGESPRAAGVASAGFERRIDIVTWLEGTLGYTGAGVELGVKQGEFAEETLTAWPGVSAYYLVDPWVHQADYADIANVADATHNAFMAEALGRTAKFGAKVKVVRKFSFDAAGDFDDCSLDYVYVDAVHDYEGALRDILDWWPKLKPGGVLAGHDYLDQINLAGVFGVKSAADRFAAAVDRPLYATTGYPEVDGAGRGAAARNILEWRSFVILK